MSLFTYLLRIFFFFFLWERGCILEDVLLIPGEQNKPSSEPISCLLEATSSGRGGMAAWEAAAPVCCLRTQPAADAASFGSEPPSCHWELGSVSGPSRWFWGDRTACVVMGSLKRLTSTEQKHRLRLTEPTQSWQTDTPPKGRPEFSSRDTTLTNRGDSF